MSYAGQFEGLQTPEAVYGHYNKSLDQLIVVHDGAAAQHAADHTLDVVNLEMDVNFDLAGQTEAEKLFTRTRNRVHGDLSKTTGDTLDLLRAASDAVLNGLLSEGERRKAEYAVDVVHAGDDQQLGRVIENSYHKNAIKTVLRAPVAEKMLSITEAVGVVDEGTARIKELVFDRQTDRVLPVMLDHAVALELSRVVTDGGSDDPRLERLYGHLSSDHVRGAVHVALDAEVLQYGQPLEPNRKIQASSHMATRLIERFVAPPQIGA